MKIPKLKIKEIKKPFKKLPRVLAERALLTFLGLFLLSLIFGLIVFYKYSLLVQKAEPQITERPPREFNEKIYQEILRVWQEKEERFQAVDTKEYPDPFR